MDILNVDEVIYNTASICSYIQLILFSNVNKKYNHICKNFIDHYNKSQLMDELNFKSLNSSIKSIQFYIKFTLNTMTLDKYTKLISCVKKDFKNSKTIKILNSTFRIYMNNECISYSKNFKSFFAAYKLLLVTIKYM